MDALPLPRRPPPWWRPHAHRQLLRPRGALLHGRASHRRHRVTRAANAEVPVAEAAVGAVRPLRAQADQVDPRLLLRRRRRTRPLAGRTNRIGNKFRPAAPLGGAVPLSASAHGVSKRSCPRNPPPRRDLRKRLRTSHTSPIPVFLHPAYGAPSAWPRQVPART